MGESKQFESLLPKEDIDLGKYKDALDFAIETDQIRNIALSGSYGSGKSSVIRSYEKEQTAQKFLHISLACFHAEGESADQSSSRPNVTKFLEGKILNPVTPPTSSVKDPSIAVPYKVIRCHKFKKSNRCLFCHFCSTALF